MENSVQSWCHRVRHLITLSALTKHIWRNREADLLRSLQVYYKLEFCRSLYWKFTWPCTFQYLVHVSGSPTKRVNVVG